MKKKNMIKIMGVLLAWLTMMTLLSACGGDVISDDTLLNVSNAETGELYFYGVVKSSGVYYARVLLEYEPSPAKDAFLYAPLAEDATAYFQHPDMEGAWSPEQYLSAKELARADKDGVIIHGVSFYYTSTDGNLTYLNQLNYYEG